MKSHSTKGIALIGLALLAMTPIRARAQRAPALGEWPNYASDKAGTKYSSLDQITAANVGRLEIAWTWRSSDYDLMETDSRFRVINIFEPTPIMASGLLYTRTGLGLVAAIDPIEGETVWLWNPHTDLAPSERPKRDGIPLSRGVSYWAKGLEKRIFAISAEHLVSLDAKTGELDPDFGMAGRVDLKLGLGEPLRTYFWSSPPLVCNDVIVIGNSTTDQQVRKESPPGHVRGYEAETGELLWVFNIIPKPGEFGHDTWQGDSADYTGHANVWTWMSADEELDYIYLPTSTPNNDWYGGHRLGDTLFAESLVCLNARTGKRVWHFQAVHHGLWDYDFPCAPILCDITVDGKKIKAVVQVSKQAFAYVFDRETGEPVWPIVEREVPPSNVPGERASPTQPFPTKPLPFDLQGFTIDDLIDFTPELRSEAIEILKNYVAGPIFSPPSLLGREPGETKGTIQSPGPVGGANWNGASYDPETQILYVPSVTAPFAAALIQPDQARSNLRYVRGGLPFIRGPQGLPFTKPPYGRITAIDLNTGEHLWVAPNGEGPRNHPLLEELNLPFLGQPGRAGLLVTKTLLFIGEGSPSMIAVPMGGGGKKFPASDKATGKVVWETELPAGTSGSPMTYFAGGRQFIVVAVSDRDVPGQFVALSLPFAPSSARPDPS